MSQGLVRGYVHKPQRSFFRAIYLKMDAEDNKANVRIKKATIRYQENNGRFLTEEEAQRMVKWYRTCLICTMKRAEKTDTTASQIRHCGLRVPCQNISIEESRPRCM